MPPESALAIPGGWVWLIVVSLFYSIKKSLEHFLAFGAEFIDNKFFNNRYGNPFKLFFLSSRHGVVLHVF